MAKFTSDANLIRLKNHQVVKFEDGEYEAESNVVANYLRQHPLVEEVDESSSDESKSQNVPTEYQSLVEEAKELDIDTQGVSKDDLAEKVAAAKAE